MGTVGELEQGGEAGTHGFIVLENVCSYVKYLAGCRAVASDLDTL